MAGADQRNIAPESTQSPLQRGLAKVTGGQPEKRQVQPMARPSLLATSERQVSAEGLAAGDQFLAEVLSPRSLAWLTRRAGDHARAAGRRRSLGHYRL